MIPFADFKAQYAAIRTEIRQAIDGVLESGWYILGEQGRAFEEEFAAYLGSAHAMGVGSGTDAIQLALMALGIGPGDEVIIPANTCMPTICGIMAAGARPVAADVSEATLTLDPASVETKLTSATKALVPVHLYGHPCDMDALNALAQSGGLVVVEDCAQAHGAMYKRKKCGMLAHAAAFSFYPTKNLGAYGDGGAVVTSDPDTAERVRSMRNYGEDRRYHHNRPGINSRLDELQAAILRVKLRYVDTWNTRRKELAAKYLNALADAEVTLPFVAPWATPSWHLFAVRSKHRDALQGHLKEKGIQTLIHYPIPVHLQEACREIMQANAGDLPIAEAACRQVLSLPLYPELPGESVERVINAVLEFHA